MIYVFNIKIIEECPQPANSCKKKIVLGESEQQSNTTSTNTTVSTPSPNDLDNNWVGDVCTFELLNIRSNFFLCPHSILRGVP